MCFRRRQQSTLRYATSSIVSVVAVSDGTLRPATQQKPATRKPSMLPTESPKRNDMFSPSEKKAGSEKNFLASLGSIKCAVMGHERAMR